MKTFRSSDGLTLAYQDRGSGRPVLCLAGLTRNSRDFECLRGPLSEFRLIMPDYRGRGGSDWDPQFLNYNPAVEAGDAFELLDHLGIGRVMILGTSRGGIVAMLMALTDRARVGGILFNDIGPAIETAGFQRILRYLGRNPECKNMEDAAQQLADGSLDFRGVPLSKWRQEAENRFRQVGDRVVISYDPGLRPASIAAFEDGDIDLWPQFSGLKGIPMSLIRGENSDLLSAGTAAKMRQVCPDLSETVALNRGHCPFLDEPESLTAIRRFLGSGL